MLNNLEKLGISEYFSKFNSFNSIKDSITCQTHLNPHFKYYLIQFYEEVFRFIYGDAAHTKIPYIYVRALSTRDPSNSSNTNSPALVVTPWPEKHDPFILSSPSSKSLLDLGLAWIKGKLPFSGRS